LGKQMSLEWGCWMGRYRSSRGCPKSKTFARFFAEPVIHTRLGLLEKKKGQIQNLEQDVSQLADMYAFSPSTIATTQSN
jgi:hypothetical protein